MNSSDMKNIVVLKNLPSNMVEEAIVILKENKKAKKYQFADKKKIIDVQNVDKRKENQGKNENKVEPKEYILKEAELVISNYISELETKSPKWKKDMKKLENKYKKSLRLNFFLGLATVLSLILSVV